MREPDLPTLLINVYQVMRKFGVNNVIRKLRQIEQKNIDEFDSKDINLIINIVCRSYGVKKTDLLSRKKGVAVSESKKMAIVLLSEIVKMPATNIAILFNRHQRSVYRVLNEYQAMTFDVKWQKDFLEKKQVLTENINIEIEKKSNGKNRKP